MSEKNLVDKENSVVIIESPEYPKYFQEVLWTYPGRNTEIIKAIEDTRIFVIYNDGQEIIPKRIYFSDAGYYNRGALNGQPYVDNVTFPDFTKKTCESFIPDTIQKKMGKVKLVAMRFFISTYPLKVEDVFPTPTEVNK